MRKSGATSAGKSLPEGTAFSIATGPSFAGVAAVTHVNAAESFGENSDLEKRERKKERREKENFISDFNQLIVQEDNF